MSKRNKNLFLEQIRPFVEKKYGKEKAVSILHNAYYKYTELCIENKDEPKAMHKHTVERIYPSIAIFEALVMNKSSKQDAKDLIFLFYSWRSAKLANKIKKIMKIPFLYTFAPSLFNKIVRIACSEEAGFGVNFLKVESDVLHFDMVSCPYCNILTKYECPELVAAYCHADVTCFGNMHKKVRFERTKTIGQGGDCCDFRIWLEK